MTTYQVFKRRWNRTWFALIAVFLAEALLQAWIPRTALTDAISRGGGLIVFIGLLWRLSQTRCLFCRKPLGLESLLWRTGGDSFQIVRCPNCGVDVRRNYPGATDETL